MERPRGWSMTSLHAILRRELYAGRVVWNKSVKRNSWGERRASRRPEGDWITYDAPELRIVPPELWAQVQTRLEQVRRSYTPWTRGQLWGGTAAAVESKHLLLGLAACQQCGGSIAVRANTHGTGRTRRLVSFYGCITHRNRGPAICSNALVMPAALAEDGVLAALDDQFFDPAIVTRALAEVRATFAQPSSAERPQAVARELARVEAQIERLVAAVQLGGGEVAKLIERLREREQHATELRTERDRLRTATGTLTARQLAELEADMLAVLDDRRAMCREQPAEARKLLNDVLVKRMTWTPHSDAQGGYYTFTAECSLGRLVTGTVQHAKHWWPQGDRDGLGIIPSVGIFAAPRARYPGAWRVSIPRRASGRNAVDRMACSPVDAASSFGHLRGDRRS